MKRFQKTVLAALLAGAISLSLSGCGKGGSTDNAQNRKEFYYVPEYQNLDIGINYVQKAVSIGDNIYMYGSSWDEGAGVSRSYLYKYQVPEGVIKEIPIDTGNDGSIQQMCVDSEGNLIMMVSRYVTLGEEDMGEEAGSSASEMTEEETEAEDAAADTQTEEEIQEDGADAELAGTGSSDSEAVFTVIDGYDDDYVPMDYKFYLELWKVSAADGSVLSQTDVTSAFEDPNGIYVQYMVMDDKDNIYLADGSQGIYMIGGNGENLGMISTENWIDSLFASKEGQVYMKTWGTEGRELRPVDLQNKKLGDPIKSEVLDGNNYYTYNQTYYKGTEKGVLVSDTGGVYTYDFEADVREDLLDWMDADINCDDVDGMGQLSDGRLWVLLSDYSTEKSSYSLAFLKKTSAAEMVEKEELLYGTMWLNQDSRKNIINFNKTSDKYHISVKEYATEDYSAGLTQFNNDITSGNGPDIIDIANIDYKQYASKGVLADLYPYMEREGIHKEDYLENVLKAYEVDGKLCGVLPQFYVTTTVAKASKVGTTPGWTLGEMLDFVENSEAENVFPYGDRTSVFYYCIYNNIDEFIDWEEGKCYFDTDDFIRVLEFAARFPEEANYNNEEGTSARLRADKILLMQTSLSSVQEFQMMNGLFGEKVTYIGYPNSERNGNLIQAVNGCVAINTKSKHKDGAWEYVKTVISEEYQDSLISGWSSWGFPVRKATLDKLFEKDMTPEYYEDENGNQVEQMKTSWGYDDFNIDIYAATQEEIDTVKEIIASANRSANSINEELSNIITEETEAFFKGQKSAEETAKIIQNRIQVYVNENS